MPLQSNLLAVITAFVGLETQIIVRKMQRFVRSSAAAGAIRQLSTKAAAAAPPAVNHLPPKKIPGITGRYAGAVYTAASKVMPRKILSLTLFITLKFIIYVSRLNQ